MYQGPGCNKEERFVVFLKQEGEMSERGELVICPVIVRQLHNKNQIKFYKLEYRRKYNLAQMMDILHSRTTSYQVRQDMIPLVDDSASSLHRRITPKS